jgi:hypothetical protein
MGDDRALTRDGANKVRLSLPCRALRHALMLSSGVEGPHTRGGQHCSLGDTPIGNPSRTAQPPPPHPTQLNENDLSEFKIGKNSSPRCPYIAHYERGVVKGGCYKVASLTHGCCDDHAEWFAKHEDTQDLMKSYIDIINKVKTNRILHKQVCYGV